MMPSRCTVDRRDTWQHSRTAQAIAAELSLLLYGTMRLERLDPVTRGQLMEAAEDCVSRAIEDHAPPADDGTPDAMQSWRDKQEHDDR